MSIYKLVNTTGVDIIIQDNPENIIKSDGTPFDLIKDAGLEVEDILGSLNGDLYEYLISLILSGDCYMFDGVSRVRNYDALCLLKMGRPPLKEDPWSMSPKESFNLVNSNEWINDEPVWNVTVNSGKEIQILSSTTICSKDVSFPDNCRAFFRVYVANGAILVYEKKYKTIADLLNGVSSVLEIKSIGNQNSNGVKERISAKTIYPKNSFMSLKSSLAMSIDIGFEMEDGSSIDINNVDLVNKFSGYLSLFLEGRSRSEW